MLHIVNIIIIVYVRQPVWLKRAIGLVHSDRKTFSGVGGHPSQGSRTPLHPHPLHPLHPPPPPQPTTPFATTSHQTHCTIFSWVCSRKHFFPDFSVCTKLVKNTKFRNILKTFSPLLYVHILYKCKYKLVRVQRKIDGENPLITNIPRPTHLSPFYILAHLYSGKLIF